MLRTMSSSMVSHTKPHRGVVSSSSDRVRVVCGARYRFRYCTVVAAILRTGAVFHAAYGLGDDAQDSGTRAAYGFGDGMHGARWDH